MQLTFHTLVVLYRGNFAEIATVVEIIKLELITIVSFKLMTRF